jgi:triacylglycerol lipase
MDHPRLGLCHHGFISGAEAILPMLLPILTGPFCLTGHSLGAALAVSAAALLTDLGRPPVVLTTFGAPRVGIGGRLGEVLAGVSGRSYHNGDDPVVQLPNWPFRHHRKLTDIGVAVIDAIADHAISAYAAALTLVPAA